MVQYLFNPNIKSLLLSRATWPHGPLVLRNGLFLLFFFQWLIPCVSVGIQILQIENFAHGVEYFFGISLLIKIKFAHYLQIFQEQFEI